MKKYLLLLFITGLFASCAGTPESVLVIKGEFGESTPFELGYFTDFTVNEIVKGELNVMEADSPKETIQLVFPPVDTPKIYVNVNPDKDQTEFIISFEDPGKDLEEMLFSPSPGSGMGDFLPPGLIMADETYLTITRIEGIDPAE